MSTFFSLSDVAFVSKSISQSIDDIFIRREVDWDRCETFFKLRIQNASLAGQQIVCCPVDFLHSRISAVFRMSTPSSNSNRTRKPLLVVIYALKCGQHWSDDAAFDQKPVQFVFSFCHQKTLLDLASLSEHLHFDMYTVQCTLNRLPFVFSIVPTNIFWQFSITLSLGKMLVVRFHISDIWYSFES